MGVYIHPRRRYTGRDGLERSKSKSGGVGGTAAASLGLVLIPLMVLSSGLHVTTHEIHGQPWQQQVSPGQIRQFIKALPGMDQETFLAEMDQIFVFEQGDFEILRDWILGLTQEEYEALKSWMLELFEQGGLGRWIAELSKALNGQGPFGYLFPPFPEYPFHGEESTQMTSEEEECCWEIVMGKCGERMIVVGPQCPIQLKVLECLCDGCNGCIMDMSWWWDLDEAPKKTEAGQWSPTPIAEGDTLNVAGTEIPEARDYRVYFYYDPAFGEGSCMTSGTVTVCELTGLEIEGAKYIEGSGDGQRNRGDFIGAAGSTMIARAQIDCGGWAPRGAVNWIGVGTTDENNGLIRHFETGIECGQQEIGVEPRCCPSEEPCGWSAKILFCRALLTGWDADQEQVVCYSGSTPFQWSVCAPSEEYPLGSVKLVSEGPEDKREFDLVKPEELNESLSVGGTSLWRATEDNEEPSQTEENCLDKSGKYWIYVEASLAEGYTFRSLPLKIHLIHPVIAYPRHRKLCACSEGESTWFSLRDGRAAIGNTPPQWSISSISGGTSPVLSPSWDGQMAQVSVEEETSGGEYLIRVSSSGCEQTADLTVYKVILAPRDVVIKACEGECEEIVFGLVGDSYVPDGVEWELLPLLEGGAVLIPDEEKNEARVQPGSLNEIYEIRVCARGLETCLDSTTLTVAGIDVDVDSDNNDQWGIPSRNREEDQQEMMMPGVTHRIIAGECRRII